ncbi:MAG: N-acetylmuramoyl-L-alanine amidase [Alphaproteobacteria bacterium]|nr:N-acetylmuramoyl-L-alanine amidase [Alphaproteobacteria bacterium]
MLVLHYTGMATAAAALERLCDPDARVSAHYLVEENGVIWRLVPESQRAFHAGISCWDGETDLNAVSIGIEIVNPGHEWGYPRFPEAQMAAIERLCQDLLARYPIPAYRVVGHSDIAPERKSDPGELFDWARLARAEIGIWPPAAAPNRDFITDSTEILAGLASIGYCANAESRTAALVAFQRRFRQRCCDGVFDHETAARLSEVSAAFVRSRAATAGPAQISKLKASCSPCR